MNNSKKIKNIFTATIIIFLIMIQLPMNTQAARKIKLSATKKTMNVGEKTTLKVKGTKKKVKWSSNNKKVASVTKKGKVKAKKPGSATISAKVGKRSLKCKIIVEKGNSTGSGTKTNFSEEEAKKNIKNATYKLNGSVFVLLNSKYEFPTSITANCYFFDEIGNPVGDSFSYLFWL